MPSPSVLGSQRIMAFAGTQDPARAKAFYRDTLGLRLISEDGFALAFNAHGIMLRVSIVQKGAVAPYTVLGWQVDDIVAAAKALQDAAVKFERQERAGRRQDRLVQRSGRQHAEHRTALISSLPFAPGANRLQLLASNPL